MDNQDNYLIKLKSVFRNKLTFWFSVVSLCVPLWGLIAVFYDQSQHHYYYNDNTFFNSIMAIGLFISVFPAVMWLLIYNSSKENCSAESFTKPFKALKVFSVTIFVLFIIGSVLFLGFLLAAFISAVNSPNPYTGYASIFYGVVLAILPIFIAIAFVIGLFIFFYLLLSYNFLNYINDCFTKSEKLNKKGNACFGYNVFLTVVFTMLAVFQILYAINNDSDLPLILSGRLYNIILFINFGIIAVKHTLEGLVAKNYFKQQALCITDNTTEIK